MVRPLRRIRKLWMVMVSRPVAASWKRGSSQSRLASRCACVQSGKISNGDSSGPSNSITRCSERSPKVQRLSEVMETVRRERARAGAYRV
jgi:hypothetical protein